MTPFEFLEKNFADSDIRIFWEASSKILRFYLSSFWRNTAVCSGGFSPQYLGARPYGERGSASLYDGGLGQSTQPGPGTEPLVRGTEGRSPSPEALFLNVQWKPQICPYFWNLETQRNKLFVLFLQKIISGHKTGG